MVMNKEYNIAVVGATGLVGRTMLKVLEERAFPVKNLYLFASEKSAGKVLKFNNDEIQVRKLDKSSFDNVDIALFSAGGAVSLEYSPTAASKGCVVIDNSAAWRMHKDVPLVVPEVNIEDLNWHHGIIANPNCSTIQMVVVLKPIDVTYGLKRVVVSTYQSISGAGQKGVDKMMREIEIGKFERGYWSIEDEEGSESDKHRIAFSLMFHPLSDKDGFTIEEKKMYDETRKIMHLPDLKIAIICVRVPTLGGHGESVNVETNKDFDINEIQQILSRQKGIKVLDDMKSEEYPTPEIAGDTDDVYIGRIHRDYSVPFGFYIWIVSDNLRKGAATNAVQIAESIVKNNLLEYERVNCF
jgi:aspartate-semialdehyde dehydrogenase